MGQKHYVIQTQPQAEALAEANLTNQRFTVFYPTLVVSRRVSRGRTVSTLEPLFPGYLFVHLDLSTDNWRTIISTRGVKRILGSDCESPSPVPTPVMDRLITEFKAGAFVHTPESLAVIAGDLARVTGGAFAGHFGRCVESRPSRVKLLMSLLGSAVEISFAPTLVERAA